MGHPVQGVGGFSGPDRTGDYVLVRPYFQPRRLTYWASWAERDQQKVALNFTHRPLGAYTAALESSGFVIETLREPRPGPQLADCMHDLELRRRVPSLVHLRARKERSDDIAL